jgi:hypothetical protein
MNQKIQPGVGYTFTSDSRGQSLLIDQPGRRRHTFEVYSNPDNGSPAVSIHPGTVNGVMPQVSGNYLDATTKPKLTIGSSGTVYLKVTRSSGQVFPTTVAVEFASTVPADTSTTGHFPIASITKTGNSLVINQTIRSSLIAGRQAYGLSGAVFYWFNV